MCGKYLQSCGIDGDGISGGSYSVPQTSSYPVRGRSKGAHGKRAESMMQEQ